MSPTQESGKTYNCSEGKTLMAGGERGVPSCREQKMYQ